VTATTEVLAETARIVASVLSGVTVRQIVVNVVRTVMIVVVGASDRSVVSGRSVVIDRNAASDLSVVSDRNVVSVLSVASGRNVVTDQLAGNALTVASVRTSLIGQCGETDQTVETVETVASVQIVVIVVNVQSVAVVTAARSVVVLSVIGVIATGIWIVTNDLSVVAT
jgi:hypothetical protein